MTAEPSSLFNGKQMRWAWIATTLIVLIFGYGITDWEGIAAGLHEGRSMVAFVAGYTLPLTVGTGVSMGLLLYNHRAGIGIEGRYLLLCIAGILNRFGFSR